MRDDDEIDLKAFTAKPAGIDRDAILFAAGQASAGGAMKWKAAASLLAATQTGTLALFLWPAGIGEPPSRIVPAVAVRTVGEPPLVPEPSSLLVLSRSYDAEAALPKSEARAVPPEPVWTPRTKSEATQ